MGGVDDVLWMWIDIAAHSSGLGYQDCRPEGTNRKNCWRNEHNVGDVEDDVEG